MFPHGARGTAGTIPGPMPAMKGQVYRTGLKDSWTLILRLQIRNCPGVLLPDCAGCVQGVGVSAGARACAGRDRGDQQHGACGGPGAPEGADPAAALLRAGRRHRAAAGGEPGRPPAHACMHQDTDVWKPSFMGHAVDLPCQLAQPAPQLRFWVNGVAPQEPKVHLKLLNLPGISLLH